MICYELILSFTINGEGASLKSLICVLNSYLRDHYFIRKFLSQTWTNEMKLDLRLAKNIC